MRVCHLTPLFQCDRCNNHLILMIYNWFYMKNCRTFLLLLCLIALLNSCQTGVESYINGISIGNMDSSLCVSDFFKRAQLIGIQEDSSCFIGDIEKIKVSENDYFVLSDMSKQLTKVDKDGRCLCTLKRVGNGHDEYILISDYDMNDSLIYILCYPNKIIVTDLSLNIQEIIEIKQPASRLCCRGKFVYLYDDISRKLYALTEHRKMELLHEETPMPSALKENSDIFYKTKSSMYYIAEGSDVLYKIDNGNTLDSVVVLDYKNKDKVIKRFSENKMLSYDERIHISCPIVKSIIEQDDHLLIIYNFGPNICACVVSLSDYSLLEDGWIKGTSCIPMIQSSGIVLAKGFITTEKCPVDTTEISVKILHELDKKNGCLVVVKYE